MRKSLLILFLTFVSPQLFGAYLVSYQTNMYSKPDTRSSVSMRARRTETVEILETDGIWNKVRIKNRVGWILRMNLTDKRQVRRASAFKPTKVRVKKKRRRIRARVARSAIGVKGLRESQVKQQINAEMNFERLKIMETFAVNEAEAFQFLMEPKN